MVLFIGCSNNRLIVKTLILLLGCSLTLTACITSVWNVNTSSRNASGDKVALVLDYLSTIETTSDLSQQELGNAIAELHTTAASGNKEAASVLAYMYLSGAAIKQDYHLAKYWYEKAAQAGNPGANYNMGLLYTYGLGTAPDTAKAAYYFERARILGFSQ